MLLYRLLTGRHPFQGVALANLLEEIRSSDPVPPCRLDSDIPRSLETICLKCLQKEPRRRYRSAQGLADDLRFWLDGRPVKARQDSVVDKGWRWCRRRPAVAALLLSLVATIVASVVGLTVLLRLSERERDGAVAARHESEENLESASKSLDQVVELLNRALTAPASIATDLPETFFQSALNEERKMLARSSTASVTVRTQTRSASCSLGCPESRRVAKAARVNRGNCILRLSRFWRNWGLRIQMNTIFSLSFTIRFKPWSTWQSETARSTKALRITVDPSRYCD